MEQYRGTTIVSVRRDDKVVIGGDGQVSQGNTVLKGNARKVRRLYHDKVIAGFAGGTADAFTLFERFEEQLVPDQSVEIRRAQSFESDPQPDGELHDRIHGCGQPCPEQYETGDRSGRNEYLVHLLQHEHPDG